MNMIVCPTMIGLFKPYSEKPNYPEKTDTNSYIIPEISTPYPSRTTRN